MPFLYRIGAVILLALWALGASWLAWNRTVATQVAKTRVEALEGDLAALQRAQVRAVEVQLTQQKERTAAKASVRHTRSKLNKEDRDAAEPRPVLSDARVERLRELADQANRTIESAGSLP